MLTVLPLNQHNMRFTLIYLCWHYLNELPGLLPVILLPSNVSNIYDWKVLPLNASNIYD